jgi:hypothetical protein
VICCGVAVALTEYSFLTKYEARSETTAVMRVLSYILIRREGRNVSFALLERKISMFRDAYRHLLHVSTFLQDKRLINGKWYDLSHQSE